MKTEEFITWMRKEHARVEELSTMLRGKVCLVPRTNFEKWIAEARDAFEHFRAHLIKHFALEESGEYLDSVLERRPTLSREVDRLKHEHRELTEIMDSVHGRMERLTVADRLLIRDCCSRIGELLSYVEHHEEHENMLVTYAFSQDIGLPD